MFSKPDPAQGSSPAVSIIIVNWNTREILRDCLVSIAEQTKVRHEVIVVDNASSDDSVAMLREHFPDVILIANDENRGFAAANNLGLEVATGRRLLLLNADTLILDGAIDRMVAWLDANPDVGCAGCQVLESPEVIQQTCFADPGPLSLIVVELGLMRLARWHKAFGRPWYKDWDRRSEREVDVISGMFMLVPRRVFEEVGGLDEAFFVYAEEADWCRRIRDAGWRCVFTPDARIIHLDGGSKSTAQIRSRMFVQMQKSHLIYMRKHHGRAGQAFARAVFVCSATLRLALFGALKLLSRDEATGARVRLSAAVLRYHLAGTEPVS